MIEATGLRAFAILAIPVIIALTPLFFPSAKLVAALAMLIFALAAGSSIGLFYVPIALLLAWPERKSAQYRHGAG